MYPRPLLLRRTNVYDTYQGRLPVLRQIQSETSQPCERLGSSGRGGHISSISWYQPLWVGEVMNPWLERTSSRNAYCKWNISPPKCWYPGGSSASSWRQLGRRKCSGIANDDGGNVYAAWYLPIWNFFPVFFLNQLVSYICKDNVFQRLPVTLKITFEGWWKPDK